MRAQALGAIQMAASMAIAGTVGWFVIASGQPPQNIVFWRCLFGAVALVVAGASFGFPRLTTDRRSFTLSAVGGVAIVANWLFLFASFSRASVAIATLIYCTQPFILLALGAAFLSEPVRRSRLLWLGLAFAGVVLILQARPDVSYASGDFAIGILLAFGAAGVFAAKTLAVRNVAGLTPSAITLVQLIVGTLVSAPFVQWSMMPTTPESWWLMVALGAAHTPLMLALQYAAFQKLPTPLLGCLFYVYPVSAMVVDFLAFGHRLEPVQLAGAALIIVAAVAMNLHGQAARAQTDHRYRR